MMADEGKRKRWRSRIALGLIVLVLATAGLSALPSGDEAFLNRFHPRTEPWQSPITLSRDFKGLVYIFRQEEVSGVADSMDRELTAKGYKRLGPIDSERKSVSYARNMGTRDEFSMMLLNSKQAFNCFLAEKTRNNVPEGGCAVVFFRPATWPERQWLAVTRFLHAE